MPTKETILKEKKNDLYHVDPRLIDVEEGFNIREDFGDIKGLAKDIKENGVRVPMRGRRNGERFILTDGERRWRSCQILISEGEEFRVPFILESKGTSEEDRLADMFSMNTGKNLNMLEMANGIAKFLKLNYTEEEIAVKIAKSRIFISNCITLLETPKSVKTLIKENKITPTLVLDIFRKNKFDKAVSIIEELNGKMFNEDFPSIEIEEDNDKKTSKKPIKKKKKITAKRVAELNKKHNSISFFGKLVKQADKNNRLVKEDKSDEYTFVRNIIEGKISKEDIESYFYI